MRAADPEALGAWYRDCLGLDADENGLWRQEGGPTVFATFESETDYFGSRAQQAMINFRVRDLDAMLAQLRAKEADVAGGSGWVGAACAARDSRARALYRVGRRACESTPTSRSHAPDTMNRNDVIIPTPIAYRPHVCPKNRIAAPVCSMIRQAP
jgi:hypothetical protein